MAMSSSVPREGNFLLERQADHLVTHSIYSGFAAGALWTAALVVILVSNDREGSVDFSRPSDGVVATLLFGAGLFTMLRREISTSFDPDVREVVQERTVGGVWQWRRRRYSFDDIAGIGINVYLGEDGKNCYRPIITLKDGKTVSLTHFEDGRLNSNEIVTDVCAVTGLPRLDVEDPK